VVAVVVRAQLELLWIVARLLVTEEQEEQDQLHQLLVHL
jgi:hypothetical protein